MALAFYRQSKLLEYQAASICGKAVSHHNKELKTENGL